MSFMLVADGHLSLYAPLKYKNGFFCLNEKFKMPIWGFLKWFFLIIWMNSQGQTPSRMIDGVALSGQSMFMLLIWRIPPLLTGEMRTDFTEVERRVASSTAKTNELPHTQLSGLSHYYAAPTYWFIPLHLNKTLARQCDPLTRVEWVILEASKQFWMLFCLNINQTKRERS